jgi:membrane-associated phospholipid phosphatase
MTARNVCTLILACALGLTVLTGLVALDVPIPGDGELVDLALSTRGESVTGAILILTFVSSSIPALFIAVVVSGIELWRVWREEGPSVASTGAAWATAAYLGYVASNIGLRIAVGRFRPGVDYIPHLLPEVQASFQRFSYPSGHAGAALFAYASLVVLAWPWKVWRWATLAVALVVVAATGFGRVYMGVHWPSDVLGGYLLGGCWLGIGMTLRRWRDR